MSRDTVIFLLQHLGFVINQKKSLLQAVQEIEFLGLNINSLNMTVSLPNEKLRAIISRCCALCQNPKTSIFEKASCIRRFTKQMFSCRILGFRR